MKLSTIFAGSSETPQGYGVHPSHRWLVLELLEEQEMEDGSQVILFVKAFSTRKEAVACQGPKVLVLDREKLKLDDLIDAD